jgi:hypothetical protein
MMTILDLRIGDFVKIKEDLNSINDLYEDMLQYCGRVSEVIDITEDNKILLSDIKHHKSGNYFRWSSEAIDWNESVSLKVVKNDIKSYLNDLLKHYDKISNPWLCVQNIERIKDNIKSPWLTDVEIGDEVEGLYCSKYCDNTIFEGKFVSYCPINNVITAIGNDNTSIKFRINRIRIKGINRKLYYY